MATAPANDTFEPVVAGEIIIVDPMLVDIVGERLRPIDPVWAGTIGRSMEIDGQITPIDIAPNPEVSGRWMLSGPGGHRLTGAQMRQHGGIEARVVSSDFNTQRRREAAENIFRRSNDPIERAAQVAELVRLHKIERGIDPTKDGRSASINMRWKKAIADEADDTTATIAIVYGWSDDVGEQLGLSARTVRNDLLLYRRLAPSLVARLRTARPLLAKNATQLRALAKLDADEQEQVVATLENSPTVKSVGDAIARVRGSNRAIDPEAKRLSTFIGAFARMGVTAKKGALPELREHLPAGWSLTEGAPPKASLSAEHERYREEALEAIDRALLFLDGLIEDEADLRDATGDRAAEMDAVALDLRMTRMTIAGNGFEIGGDA